MREPLPIRNVSRCTRIPVPIPHTQTPIREMTTPRWRMSAAERRVRAIGDCQTLTQGITFAVSQTRPESRNGRLKSMDEMVYSSYRHITDITEDRNKCFV